MSFLKIQNICVSYGKHPVLKDLNLEIHEPGIYGVIGPNGAGKSTLFNTIANLIRPKKGSIQVLDRPNTDSQIFKSCSFLKDNRVLYPFLTGTDHLNYIRSMQNLSQSRMEEVIDAIDIRSFTNRKVETYSLGMKQSLLLAMALLNKPKLMILDEPMNGLDPTRIVQTRKILLDHAQGGAAILISSHTLAEMDRLTHHFLFLKDGKITEHRVEEGQEGSQRAEDLYLEMFPILKV